MDTATVKQILLVASLATMALLEIDGAPTKPCYLSHYRNLQAKESAPRALRNKYEELRLGRVEPWRNCSGEHLEPQWKLDGLTKWEKLEAVEMEVGLAIHVLQNQSEPAVATDASRVLEILTHLREDLMLCIRHKPPSHKESGHFLAFQEHFQKFNNSNAVQSSQCLEEAVGLNIIRLLQEVHQVSRDHHHHHHRRRRLSN